MIIQIYLIYAPLDAGFDKVLFIIRKGIADVHVLFTSDKWFEVTYKEDKALFVSSFAELMEQRVYGKKLWQ